MTIKERLMQELDQASEDLLQEVLDFVMASKSRPLPLANEMASAADSSPPSDSSPTGVAALLALVEQFAAEMTAEELAQLPTDGAIEHDHYIYGTPKRHSHETGE